MSNKQKCINNNILTFSLIKSIRWQHSSVNISFCVSAYIFKIYLNLYIKINLKWIWNLWMILLLENGGGFQKGQHLCWNLIVAITWLISYWVHSKGLERCDHDTIYNGELWVPYQDITLILQAGKILAGILLSQLNVHSMNMILLESQCVLQRSCMKNNKVYFRSSSILPRTSTLKQRTYIEDFEILNLAFW